VNRPLAQSPASTTPALKAGAGDEWLTYGLTQGETRFSPLKDINATNVKRLSATWSYEVGSGGGREATPLV
jgi:glucose dehydrogenase